MTKIRKVSPDNPNGITRDMTPEEQASYDADVANENKNDSQTNTIRDLNLKIQNDTRVDFSLLPLSDGLSFIRKK